MPAGGFRAAKFHDKDFQFRILHVISMIIKDVNAVVPVALAGCSLQQGRWRPRQPGAGQQGDDRLKR